MLWQNTKNTLQLSNGEITIKLPGMFGVIQHLIITPSNRETIWSAQLIDKDDDVVFEVLNHDGRFDDKSNIPVGNQGPEEYRLRVFDATANDKFKAIVKVREIV